MSSRRPSKPDFFEKFIFKAFFEKIIFKAVTLYIRINFRKIHKRFNSAVGFYPNIASPRSVGELLQWRKVFDHNPLFCIFSDKLEVKGWVKKRAPEVKVAEVLWVSENAMELPECYLNNTVVIKTNHGCDFNYFPGDNNVSDIKNVRECLQNWLRINFSKFHNEWSYGMVKRKVFVERLVSERKNTEDLKFWSHDGVISVAYVAKNEKQPDERNGYFLPDGNPVKSQNFTLGDDYVLPACFFEAKKIAERISVGVDYIRIDFIMSNGEIFLCEITVYPGAGYSGQTFTSSFVLRAWLKKLDKSWFMRTRQSIPMEIYKYHLRRHFDRLSLQQDGLSR